MDAFIALEEREGVWVVTESGYGVDEHGQPARLSCFHVKVIPLSTTHWGVVVQDVRAYRDQTLIKPEEVYRVYDDKRVAQSIAQQQAERCAQFYARERGLSYRSCPQI